MQCGVQRLCESKSLVSNSSVYLSRIAITDKTVFRNTSPELAVRSPCTQCILKWHARNLNRTIFFKNITQWGWKSVTCFTWRYFLFMMHNRKCTSWNLRFHLVFKFTNAWCGAQVVLNNRLALLENNDKCNFNWSLWGASHVGLAKLVDCNQIQGHVVIAVFQ